MASNAGHDAEGDDGVVELRFAALPEHVRTARLIAVALARRARIEEGLLDEVRLAVGEACSRAVGLHRRNAPGDPVTVVFTTSVERFGIEVADVVGKETGEAEGEDGPPDADMGLAVLTGLVDDLRIDTEGSNGVIRMGWPAVANTAPSVTGQLLS